MRVAFPRWLLLIALIIPGTCHAQDARYIIQFKEESSVNSHAADLGRVQRKSMQSLDGKVADLGDVALQEIDRIPMDNSVVLQLRIEDAARVSARSDVASIELDSEVRAYFATNDSAYSQQYALNGEFGSRVQEAWDTTVGSPRAIVAVIDTGADLGHADLAPNLWRNSRELADNGLDDDGSGCIDDIHGCDLINKDGSPQDDNGHGTHVAGIVAAEGNNAIGVAGVAWGARMLIVKALDSQGAGFSSGIAKAIDYVKELKSKGVPIVAINLSLGGGAFSRTLFRAVERARNHDILVIAAAGNEASNNDRSPSYPASMQLDNIVSVAASDEAGKLATFSNYGGGTVHIAAPGARIWSTSLRRLGYSYRALSGTSMASPLVAGVASLIASANPELSILQVRAVLLSAVRPLPSLQGYVITGAIVDAQAALAAARVTTALPRVAGYVRYGRQALSDATVTIRARIGVAPVSSTTTSTDGSYSFSQLPLGVYVMKVTKPGFRFSPVTVRARRAQTIWRSIYPRRVTTIRPNRVTISPNRGNGLGQYYHRGKYDKWSG